MRMLKIWEILNKFKKVCKRRGWKTCENDDWVEIDKNYHSFVCAGDIHSSSFRKIASGKKCTIREGHSYNVVEASYVAWLFSRKPSQSLMETVLDIPDFCETTAMYDLSPLLDGKRFCLKLNNTGSAVFQEFETFLQEDLGVNFKPMAHFQGSATNAANFVMCEPA